MKSKKPKVLEELCGSPMLGFVLDSLDETGIKKRALVLGYAWREVKKAFPREKSVIQKKITY